jgi:hypothetical protein
MAETKMASELYIITGLPAIAYNIKIFKNPKKGSIFLAVKT